MKKGILILGNYPPPFGGVPRHIEYLAPYLVEKGWDVHILSVGNSGVEKKDGFMVYKSPKIQKVLALSQSLLKHNKKSGLRSIRALTSSPRSWLSVRIKSCLGRHIIEKNGIDIISAYNLFSNGLAGALLSEKLGIPLVLTNFGEIFSERRHLEKNIDIINYVLGRAQKNLSCSRHCADSYKQLGLSPQVEVVYYGVDLKRFSVDRDGTSIRQRLGLDREDDVVLFVGRMIKEMGLQTVLAAVPELLKRNKRMRFLIVGGKGELTDSVFQMRTKFKKNVFAHPDLPFEELADYYSASTIVLVPTSGDRACSSLTAMEAMAAGKPVIAANIGGIPEVVVGGKTGLLVPPENPSALATAILDLLDDKQRMKGMGILGRERVEKLFDKDMTNRKIERIFSEVVRT